MTKKTPHTLDPSARRALGIEPTYQIKKYRVEKRNRGTGKYNVDLADLRTYVAHITIGDEFEAYRTKDAHGFENFIDSFVHTTYDVEEIDENRRYITWTSRHPETKAYVKAYATIIAYTPAAGRRALRKQQKGTA